ncbi:hypothetical protein [Streptomyces sp. SDr-06]|uniref:hypothetical protein n=1 Tax=Streptomyces sp. SDr-06 TaxID=2267702 RepID=UPI0011C03536|nr:hypothetical protein [Streptomyces sp. SDr-06]
MTSRDPLAWRSELEPAERRNLVSELAGALLGYWHSDPDDTVLDRVAEVIGEWQALAATPDRIRPGDIITLRNFEGGAS